MSGKICLCVLLLSVSLSNCWIPKPHTLPNKFKNVNYEDSKIDPGEPLILTPWLTFNISNARKQSRVNSEDFKDIESYSGFFTVNEQYNSNLFFWFFPAETGYKQAPVILWLQGGPGGSSLFGLFAENGPFEFDDKGKIKRRQYSWTKEHSVLYIDNPAGTGYSFTDPGGYATEETQIGEELYTFLVQFFTLFPELQTNDFIISGESYAGKYIPAVGYSILKNNPTADVKINLKGLAIGDGLTDPVHQYQYAEYLYQLGFIDSSAKQKMDVLQQMLLDSIADKNWKNATRLSEVILSMYTQESGLENPYNYLQEEDPTGHLEDLASMYVEQNYVRRDLHVGKLEYGSAEVYDNLRDDLMKSVAPWVSELLSNYRVMLYTGEVDVIVAYPLTLNYLQHLTFSSAEEYKIASRKLWKVNDHIAGYVKQAGNLSEVLVRGAGHMVPYDQPEWAYDMIYKFSRDIPLHRRLGSKLLEAN